MAMTLTQFVKKYQGTKVDFDGAHGAQCVDLFRRYWSDVFQLPQLGPVDGAKDLWFAEPHGINKTSDSVLADYGPGDVLIWDKTKTNPYGHVAILVSVYNTRNFIVFEQDGFKQDGAKLVMRSREGLLGAYWK